MRKCKHQVYTFFYFVHRPLPFTVLIQVITMKTHHLLFFLLITLPVLLQAQSLETRFQQLLDSIYTTNKDAVGVLVHIESPDNEISWTSAVGLSDRSTQEALHQDQPVLIASNTKPYVAASILRLVEMQRIQLNQPIKKLLSRKTRKLFIRDGYDLDEITVKHLLSHTSGIQDYVNEDYFNFIDQNPRHRWLKEEQIKRTIEIGAPQSSPGTKFSYADINYLLLTEIIERETKEPFYTAMRALLKFEALNINHTWFESLEPIPDKTLPLAHQYSDKHDWDSYNLDPSWDLYGGGGIASTSKDVALFFQYLFEGKIIEDKFVLEQMYTYVLPQEESKYCLGISHFNFGYEAYYHGGWWGTSVLYSPDTNTSVAVFTLQKGKRSIINPFLGKSIQRLLIK